MAWPLSNHIVSGYRSHIATANILIRDKMETKLFNSCFDRTNSTTGTLLENSMYSITCVRLFCAWGGFANGARHGWLQSENGTTLGSDSKCTHSCVIALHCHQSYRFESYESLNDCSFFRVWKELFLFWFHGSVFIELTPTGDVLWIWFDEMFVSNCCPWQHVTKIPIILPLYFSGWPARFWAWRQSVHGLWCGLIDESALGHQSNANHKRWIW